MKKLLLLMGILLIANCCYAEQATQVNDGRYVIYQHPTFRGDQYLLDTRTGKIWIPNRNHRSGSFPAERMCARNEGNERISD